MPLQSQDNLRHAVVIGAGIGGLAAAADLASRGWRVSVCDKEDQVGGKMRQVFSGAAAIDAGPTVLTMRDVFDDLFALAGTQLQDHVHLEPLQVLARHTWPDGSALDLFADPKKSQAAIGEFAGAREAEGFERFLAHAQRIWQTVEGPFVRGPRPTPLTILREFGWKAAPMLARIDSRRSVWQALGEFFSDPRLHQLFGRYATYSGCSPFLAPGTLNLIAWVEAAGVWQLRGGIHQLAQALATLVTGQGGSIYLGKGAKRIATAKGRVSGVELDTGEFLSADAVIFAGDVSALGRGLLGQEVVRAVEPTERGQRSLSALTWCVQGQTRAVGANGLALHHHNVFFGPDYRDEFSAIFERGELPETPTVYICAQDRGAAVDSPPPQGPERLLILVNAPPSGDLRTPSAADLDACEERTFAHLCRLGLEVEPSAPMIRTGPQEFERLFPASGGALYGEANHRWNASLQRPGATTAIPGLFLAGGTAHPGAGVPMAALSGRLAAAAADQAVGQKT